MTTAANAGEPYAPVPPPESILLTVKQLPRQQPGLTEGGIRWAIFNEHNNGLAKSGAVVRVGRRVLIDPALFMAWMRTNPQLSPPKPKAGQKVKHRVRTMSLPQPGPILES
jgi:hypothetical protein